MGIEFYCDEGRLVWVRNPFTGDITYFTHVHRKRIGFVRQAQQRLLAEAHVDRERYEAALRAELEASQRECPFCPGNEDRSPDEVCRLTSKEVLGQDSTFPWLIRAVRNLVPRIPECCTGGQNESYVVIEDPRHFADGARGHEDLLYSALLPVAQFEALLVVDRQVALQAYANPAVKKVLIRKNQGHESGASQPHVHNQVIGSDRNFPAIERECTVTAREPTLWKDIVEFSRKFGFVIGETADCVAYFCPFGTFPRSYEIVCLDHWEPLPELPEAAWRRFARMLHEVLQILGPLPLDYEVHDGPGVPLHAHVNSRHYPYSNIGGTLNLPSLLLDATPPWALPLTTS
ncbi:MAG: hypothetical protein KatS3mg077_3305 [Candidatus Binatia bacterium]|nr:MAG: hypothetical protein KatS3mg077_3305 [Candidatus Binatia bacterium]